MLQDRKGRYPDRRGGGEKLVVVEGGKTITNIYCIFKSLFWMKGKKKRWRKMVYELLAKYLWQFCFGGPEFCSWYKDVCFLALTASLLLFRHRFHKSTEKSTYKIQQGLLVPIPEQSILWKNIWFIIYSTSENKEMHFFKSLRGQE